MSTHPLSYGLPHRYVDLRYVASWGHRWEIPVDFGTRASDLHPRSEWNAHVLCINMNPWHVHSQVNRWTHGDSVVTCVVWLRTSSLPAQIGTELV